MIVPHAGGANTAEGQSVLRDVQERFVHAYAAGQCGLQHLLLLRAIIREQVERERMRTVVDVRVRGVETVGRDQGQHGPNKSCCITRTSLEQAVDTVNGSVRWPSHVGAITTLQSYTNM